MARATRTSTARPGAARAVPGEAAAEARRLWRAGDWAGLAALAPERLDGSPLRGFLLAMTAAALARTGEDGAARDRLALALGRGCAPGDAARLLLAGAGDSLAGAAAALGASRRLAREVSRSRAARAGLSALPLPLPLPASAPPRHAPPPPAPPPADPNRPRLSVSGLNRYATLPRHGFLLVETKSLPRSGLHYLGNSLERVLGRQFSFCEWYQEPGCCRQNPCAVTAHAEAALRGGVPALRLTKSHDFALADPDYAPEGAIRRLILIRDPAHVLTSWWLLGRFEGQGPVLRAAGLAENGLLFRHDPAELAVAYAAIDRHFDAAAAARGLGGWLDGRRAYILGFIRKWAASTARHASPLQRILRYEDLPGAIAGLVRDLGPLPAATQARLAAFAAAGAGFRSRGDPFAAPTPRLGAFLQEYRAAFLRTACEIAAGDGSGLLAAAARAAQAARSRPWLAQNQA